MIDDLATYHHPVSDFDTSPDTALGTSLGTSLGTESPELSAEQVQAFEHDGFVGGIPLLSSRQIDWLRDELATLVQTPGKPEHALWYEFHANESTDPARVLFHALGAWRIARGFHDLLWLPQLVRCAEQLLGGPVRFWHDQLFCKPAHHGGVVAWHQDYSYWTRTKPVAHLTCWIGLDVATSENGCVQYIPGSHRWDLLPITGLANDMTSIRKVLTESQWQQFRQPVAMEMPAGHCVFHHALAIHGSLENQTPQPRRGVVINFLRDGVVSDSDEPLLGGVPPIEKGSPVAGKFFPLLSQT